MTTPPRGTSASARGASASKERSDERDQGHERAGVGHRPHAPVGGPRPAGCSSPAPYWLSYCDWSGFMPWTSPSKSPVARNESSRGISMSKLGVWSSWEKPPIWKSENEAGCSRVPERLGGGDLHRLVVGRDDPEVAAEPEVEAGDRHEDDQRQLRRATEELDVATAQRGASTRRRRRRPRRSSGPRGSRGRTPRARTRSRAAPRCSSAPPGRRSSS